MQSINATAALGPAPQGPQDGVPNDFRHAPPTTGLVKLARAIPDVLLEYLTPRDVATLASTARDFRDAYQVMLPKRDPRSEWPPAGTEAPELRRRLQAQGAPARHMALDWLWQWAVQVSPGGNHGTARAAQLLESLPAWQISDVHGRTECPEFLKDAYFAPSRGPQELARALIKRYALGDERQFDDIVEHNDLQPISLDFAAHTMTINERCRPWLRLGGDAGNDIRDRLVQSLDQFAPFADPQAALAGFLRADPGRGDPAFAEVLAALMVKPDLRTEGFRAKLQEGPGGIAPDIVARGHALALERVAQAAQG